MIGWIIAGIAGVGVLLYELVPAGSAPAPTPGKAQPSPPPHTFVPPPRPHYTPPPSHVNPAPSGGTSAPHVVPGGSFVYTGAQASPSAVQAAADALAKVDPCARENEQLVRNFQDAAGLAQRPGGYGWDQVSPTGTDGRYGHDVQAVLAKYVPNPPSVCSTRPSWWGSPGTYTNR